MTAEKEILATIVRRLGANTVLRLVREVAGEESPAPVEKPEPTEADMARATKMLRAKGVKVA